MARRRSKNPDPLFETKPAPRTTEADLVAAEVRGFHERLPRDEMGEAILTEEFVEAISGLVSKGQTLQNAARMVGVRGATLQAWVAKGAVDMQSRTPSLESALAWALNRSLGVQEGALVQATMRGVGFDPKLALEALSRRNPADWAPALPEREDLRKLYSGMTEGEIRAEIARLTVGDAKVVDAEPEPPRLALVPKTGQGG